MKASSKIKQADELREICLSLYSNGKKAVFTNGCFDIIHRGHAENLERTSDFGDILIVGLNSDDTVGRLKGKDRPLISQEDRAYLLASLA